MSRYLVSMTDMASSPVEAKAWTAGDSTFGARLALIRQHMAWNAKEAALACGIPQQSWRSWEIGGVVPHGSRYFDLCAQIARTTGCDYGWLVDRRPSGSSIATCGKPRTKLRSITGEGRDSGARNRPLVVALASDLTQS